MMLLLMVVPYACHCERYRPGGNKPHAGLELLRGALIQTVYQAETAVGTNLQSRGGAGGAERGDDSQLDK